MRENKLNWYGYVQRLLDYIIGWVKLIEGVMGNESQSHSLM